MIKKAIVLFLAVLFHFVQLNGQRPSLDILYLKDGSILKGEIKAYKEGEGLQFLLRSGQEIYLEDSDLERMVLDKKVRPSPIETKTLYHAFYFSANTGSNFFGDGDWGLGFEHLTGYWFSEGFSLGLGTGMVQFSSTYPWNVIPLYLDIKLKSNRRSPYYLGMDAGVGFPLRNESNNILGGSAGERLRMGMGKIWTTRTGTGLSIELSYLHQRTFFRSNSLGWRVEDDFTIHNMAFKRYQFRFGVLF